MKIYSCNNCFYEISAEDYIHYLECRYCGEKMIMKREVHCECCENDVCINCFKGASYEEHEKDN